MERAHGQGVAALLHVADELLHKLDALGVHAGRMERNDLGEAVVPVDARAFDRREAHRRRDGDAQDAGDLVHAVAHAPAARAARKQQQPRAADDRRLVVEVCVDGEHVVAVGHLMPGHRHVVSMADARAVHMRQGRVRDGFADSRGGPFLLVVHGAPFDGVHGLPMVPCGRARLKTKGCPNRTSGAFWRARETPTGRLHDGRPRPPGATSGRRTPLRGQVCARDR